MFCHFHFLYYFEEIIRSLDACLPSHVHMRKRLTDRLYPKFTLGGHTWLIPGNTQIAEEVPASSFPLPPCLITCPQPPPPSQIPDFSLV